MTTLIDRTKQSKGKMHGSKQRFLGRYQKQIQESISKSKNNKIIAEGDKFNVSLPTRSLEEPKIHRGVGGVRDRVFTGNKKYQAGDEIDRPSESSHGSGAGSSGVGEDTFEFSISLDEYAKLFFEGLELPKFVKKDSDKLIEYKCRRKGFVPTGTPSNMSIPRTMKSALARRIATASKYKKEIKRLTDQMQNQNLAKKQEIELQLAQIKKKLTKVPFIDDVDIRYHNPIQVPMPMTRAVVFFIMDVSGSMDEVRKDTAKAFFLLFRAFLKHKYTKIEVVFIRHHIEARTVTEDEFFYARETGGTIVSSALIELNRQMTENYPPDAWNIYVAQASDGDNWGEDNYDCARYLSGKILPYIRYYTYVEVLSKKRQELWEMFEKLQESHECLKIEVIEHQDQVYPIFRKFFISEVI